MPRVLILSPTLLHSAATINPRAIRSERLTRGLAERGFEVDVASWWGGEGEPAAPSRARRLYTNAAGNPLEPGDTDPLGPWGAELAEQLAAEPSSERPDVIVAIALPVGALKAGALLRHKLGVPLVADLGDPWHAPSAAAEQMRAATLAAADALITTTPELAEELVPLLRAGVPTLLAPAGGEIRTRLDAPEPPLFVHLGVLSAGRADPAPAFNVLARMHDEGRIEFRSHSAGLYEGLHRLPHPHLPPLPHAEALELLSSASAALILGNRTRTQLPSKAFELACTETWGLCVTELSDDPTAALLRGTGHGVIVANGEAAIAAAVGDILGRERRGERPYPDPAHSWDRRCEEIANLLIPLAAGAAVE